MNYLFKNSFCFIISIFLFFLLFLFIFIPFSSKIYADNNSLSSIQEIVVNDEVLSKIVSFEQLHFTAGYKQGFDTSCGIAVAASILKFFYNINLDEKSLIEQFFTILSAKKDYTISLLDIKKIIEYYGLNVKGVKITRNQILKYSYYAPIILHFEKPEKHFTIYTGFYGQYLFLLDPSIGLHFISDKDFDNKFSGFALIIYGKDEIKNITLINKINQQLKDKIIHLYSISNTWIH